MAPFQPLPDVAVAVSGGADSMALALLLQRWVMGQGGRLTALTVDHGLRAEASREAEQVGQWLGQRGIAHHILRWSGPKPCTGIQAQARAARYDLMGQWCRDHGIPALAVAHHQQDQAETLLLRLRQQSGLDGLAAMAAWRQAGHVTVLRPLLTVPRQRLSAVLAAAGQDYVNDPSNHDRRYERVQMRHLVAQLNLSVDLLADTAQVLGHARQTMAALVARAESLLVSDHPMGFAVVDGVGLAGCPPEIGLRLLGRVVQRIGGRRYAPGMPGLQALYARQSGTLAGCRVVPRPDGVLLVCRENRHVEGPVVLEPGRIVAWDGRFAVSAAPDSPAPVVVQALGPAGWQQVKAQGNLALASPLRFTVPALWYKERVLCLPHMGYTVPDASCIFGDCHYFSIKPLR